MLSLLDSIFSSLPIVLGQSLFGARSLAPCLLTKAKPGKSGPHISKFFFAESRSMRFERELCQDRHRLCRSLSVSGRPLRPLFAHRFKI